MSDKVNKKISLTHKKLADSAKRVFSPNFSRDSLNFRNREKMFLKFVETRFLKNLKEFTRQLPNKLEKQE